MENEQKPNIFVRVAIIIGILIILFIIAYGIIAVVPRMFSSLADVNLSFSSLFGKQPTTGNSLTGTNTASSSNQNGVIIYGNASSTATTTKTISNTNTTTNTNTNYNSNQNTVMGGTPDLSIKLVDESITNASNEAVIRFSVSNVGNGSSPSWSIKTTEPMLNASDDTRETYGVRALAPGQSTGPITLTLTGMQPAGGIVTISVNSDRTFNETSFSNNSISITIPAGTYSTNVYQNTYSNNYNSGTYNYNNTGNYNYNNGYNTSGNYQNYPADLSIQITSVGVINPSTGLLTQTTNFNPGDTAQVNFTVSNVGGQNSGPFSISAALPIYTNSQYTASGNSISPGQSENYNIDMTGLRPGASSISVMVNPSSGSSDANQSNNTASTYISVN